VLWDTPTEGASTPGDSITELAAFVRAQLGRGPTVLWTEAEPVPAPADETVAALAAALGPRLGRAVRRVPALVRGRAPGAGADTDGDVLLLQCRSASDVLLAGPPGRRPQVRMRLRAGQSLLMPGGWGYTLDARRAVRPLVLWLPAVGS
jgi:hypothetical protein